MRVPLNHGLAVLCLALAPAAAREPPPAPYCMDAREVIEVWQRDAHTLAVRLGDESRYRLELADACPVPDGGERPSLLAPAGWVCGSNEEKLRVGGRECAVSGIARIDARQFAELALAANRFDPGDGVETLDAVVVTEQRRRGRGFRGTTAYCFDSRFVRGISEDAEGVLVETSPRRSGGNRYYRVELGRSCPELSSMAGARIVSGVGSNVICGHPGDRVIPSAEEGVAGVFEVTSPLESPLAPPRNAWTGMAPTFGCPITRVYPLLSGE